MKSPAFQFYPADYLADEAVQMMTLEEEGVYIRLLSYCWREGSIPSDPDKCARLVGKGASTTVVRVVQGCFNQSSTDGSRLVHPRLEAEKAKQEAWVSKSREGGLKSAKVRLNLKGGSTTVAEKAKGGSEMVDKCLEPNGNSSSSSSSSDICNGTRFKIPTIDELKLHGAKIGLPIPEVFKFFNFYSSKGWKVGKSPMKSWPHAMSNWKLNVDSPRSAQPELSDKRSCIDPD